MSLLKLYLIEGNRHEQQLSPAEVEKRWPGAMVAFDRDLQGIQTSFVVIDGGGWNQASDKVLFANTKGNGWWKYDDDRFHRTVNGSGDYDDAGHWVRVEKPGSARGALAVQQDAENDAGSSADYRKRVTDVSRELKKMTKQRRVNRAADKASGALPKHRRDRNRAWRTKNGE